MGDSITETYRGWCVAMWKEYSNHLIALLLLPPEEAHPKPNLGSLQ